MAVVEGLRTGVPDLRLEERRRDEREADEDAAGDNLLQRLLQDAALAWLDKVDLIF